MHITLLLSTKNTKSTFVSCLRAKCISITEGSVISIQNFNKNDKTLCLWPHTTRLCQYNDDSLLLCDSVEECQSNVMETVKLSVNLKSGFTVHPDKSVREPRQVLEYLSCTLTSWNMTISLSFRKANKLNSLVAHSHDPGSRQCIGILVVSLSGVQ